MTAWDGDEYQQRFDGLAASGAEVHGEADLVESFAPTTVLDAGCGTGRVAIELARRGFDVVGVDIDPSMLATARKRAPDLEWIEADLTDFHLGRTFDVVVLAGNVPLFTRPGSQAELAAACATHVAGLLVAGFSTDRGYTADDWDQACRAAGLEAVDRFATWSKALDAGGPYAVAVHRPVQ